MAARSDYVGRLRNNAHLEVVKARELTAEARAAGVVCDAVVRVGVTTRADHPTRVVILRVVPHAKRRLSPATAAKPPTEIRLVTNLLELPAELIALIDQSRWTIELTFEESRAHLGVETQRQCCDRSIERETPGLLGLYSVVALTQTIVTGKDVPRQVTAWCQKTTATFADCLALVRRHLWAVEDFSKPDSDPRFATILRSDLDRPTNAVCYGH